MEAKIRAAVAVGVTVVFHYRTTMHVESMARDAWTANRYRAAGADAIFRRLSRLPTNLAVAKNRRVCYWPHDEFGRATVDAPRWPSWGIAYSSSLSLRALTRRDVSELKSAGANEVCRMLTGEPYDLLVHG